MEDPASFIISQAVSCLTQYGFEVQNTDLTINSSKEEYILKLFGLRKLGMDIDLVNNLILENESLDKYFDMKTKKFAIEFKPNSLWSSEQVSTMLSHDIISKTTNPKNILVDFTSPNIAKDLHVGHLRSSVIGESICRLLEKLGHNVLRINHVGDWGTQFGMLIEYLDEKFPDLNSIAIDNLQTFYQESKLRCATDPEFKKRAYQTVVLLQSGDPVITQKWKLIKNISHQSYEKIFDRLGVTADEVGESFYQQFIPELMVELEGSGLLSLQDDGRRVIEIDGYQFPLIVQKSDGGYTYDTTDLAALRYRLTTLGMDEIYYVVDGGDSHKFHFQMLFETARRCGWLTNQRVEHIEFGFVLGPDGKRFRSRDGGTIKLEDLLNKAVTKASELLEEKITGDRNDLTDDDKKRIIQSVAIGSVKYADLATKRVKNYKFSFERMLTLQGNSCPYLLYSLVRIASIGRKAGQENINIALNGIKEFLLETSHEIQLGSYLSKFPFILAEARNTLMFHQLCKYIYELSSVFNRFVENCRVLTFNSDGELESVDYNRLLMCEATRKIYEEVFYLLGIKPLDRM